MNDFQHAYETRDRVLERLSEDLLGGEADARLTEAPLTRFVMGILYPEVESDARAPVQTSVEDEVENDIEAEAGNGAPDDVVDPGVSLSRVHYPRSMGMTLALADNPGAGLQITIGATRYEPDGEEEWRAVEVRPDPLRIDTSRAAYRTVHVIDGLDLVVHCREPHRGAVAVTLTLVNTQTARPGEKDSFAWFRPYVTARAVGSRLVERPPSTPAGTDELEIASQELLFRDVQSYAVGHGCAVRWSSNAPDEVSTTYLPRHELLLSEAAGGEGLDLSMTNLAEDNTFEVLDDLIDRYRHWIGGLPSAAGHVLGDDEAETLRRHMADAASAADRMEAGLRLLRTDDDVRRAFQMTNRAMAQQRSRQEHHRSGALGNPPSTEGARWRPFQMAFILLNLAGWPTPITRTGRSRTCSGSRPVVARPRPTSASSAIAILLRRLRDPRAAGVSVIMRYTLRLLTLQQFQRATGLICALEIDAPRRSCPTRRRSPSGCGSARARRPTASKKLDERCNKARKPGARDLDDDESDPVQLLHCPVVRHAARPSTTTGSSTGPGSRSALQQRRLRVPQRPARPHHRRGRLPRTGRPWSSGRSTSSR